MCTSGTPSRIEVDALARLAATGSTLAVRADFDDSGLNHVRAVLAAAPTAIPWRMGAADYLAGLRSDVSGNALRSERLGATAWDPSLRDVMARHGVAVHEEALLDALLADISYVASAAA